MIICHPLKLIFIKTKKVAGTSFEIALSSFCGPHCVITPITPRDEATRAAYGYRGPQNHARPVWPDGSRSDATFVNHMPAEEVRRHVPEEIWESYTKITIWRDPFDAAISRYHFELGPDPATPFVDFVSNNRAMLAENVAIAPLRGPAALDRYLRYEQLERDIRDLGVDGLWERFAALAAKAGRRPRDGTRPEEVYRRSPEAARIVAEACAEEIGHFGYRAPARKPPATARSARPHYYFTLTAGRTGTRWLANFLEANLGIESIHEPLGIDDYGTRLPDIRCMRTFNDIGFDDHLARFWRDKLASLPGTSYAETGHTLAKCGLIEALADSDLAPQATIVVLTRNLADQVASYVIRKDLCNAASAWLWYLHGAYRNLIVCPSTFAALKDLQYPLWYAIEMTARQAYYKTLYGHRLRFVDADIDDIATEAGARAFLERLGSPSTAPILPPRANVESRAREKEELSRQIGRLLRMSGDASALATRYIASGRRLHAPGVPARSTLEGVH